MFPFEIFILVCAQTEITTQFNREKKKAISQGQAPPNKRYVCTLRKFFLCVCACVRFMATRSELRFPLKSFHCASVTALSLLTISLCILPSAPDMKPQTGTWRHASPHAAVSSTLRP